MIAPSPPAASSPPAALLFVADLGQHRVGDRPQRDRGGDARARRPAQQERRQHHGAPGAGGLAAHRRERKVDEELAGVRVLQERAEDREQDDQRRRHVDGRAEDAFQRHVHVPDQPADLVTLVRPGRRQPGAGERIEDEQEVMTGITQPLVRRMASMISRISATPNTMSSGSGDVLRSVKSSPPMDHVDDDGDRQCRQQPVPPHDAVAIPPAMGNTRKLTNSTIATCTGPQRLGRHDAVGGVQVEHRHQHRGQRDEQAQCARQVVGRPLFLLDEGLGLLVRASSLTAPSAIS
jgi:hypothetical protein